MKTIADVLINCSVKGRIILMHKKSIDENLGENLALANNSGGANK